MSFIVLIGFNAYYYYWLQNVHAMPVGNGTMQSYWKNYAFPLFSIHINEIKVAKQLIDGQILSNFLSNKLIITELLCISIFVLIKDRDKYTVIFIISTFFALFASSIQMFPMSSRLWLFIIPFICIYAFYSLDKLTRINLHFKLIGIIIMITIILTSGGSKFYRNKDNIYRSGQEVNFNINYLKNNVHEGEKIAILEQSFCVTKFNIGYDTEKIGNVINNNIIWLRTLDYTNDKDSNNDITTLVNTDKCYIVSSHNFRRIEKLLNISDRKGFLELIMNPYNTPLYYYTNNVNFIKQRVSYEIIDINNNYKYCDITVRITNTGKSYLNGTKYDNIFLSSKKRPDIKLKLNDQIGPQNSAVMHISFAWHQDEKFVDLQLKREEKFWFDELDCKPLHIVRPNH